jgi:MFS family permease
MVLFDQTVVAVVLEPMAQGLRLTVTSIQRLVLIYGLSLASLTAVGVLAISRFGMVRTFYFGVAPFGIASASCGLAPPGFAAQPFIDTARSLQGAGAALMLPVATSAISGLYVAQERARALTLYAGVAQIFFVLGPVVGGLLTHTLGWRSVFFVNLALGASTVWVIAHSRLHSAPAGGSLPVRQPLLVVPALALTVLGLYQCGIWGVTDPKTVALLTTGILLLTICVWILLRSPCPLLEVRLLRVRAIAVPMALTFLIQASQLIVIVHGAVYLRHVTNLSAVSAGASLLSLVVALATGTSLSGYVLDLFGSVTVPVLGGLGVACLGMAAWAVGMRTHDNLWQVPGMFGVGLGIGLPVPTLSSVIMGSVGPGNYTGASVLRQTLRQLGGAVGIATAGAVVLGKNPPSLDAAGVVSASAAEAGILVAGAFLATAFLVATALPARAGLPRAG